MSKEITQMSLYEKLSEITRELGVVAKNLDVNMGRSSYKAVGEADVLAAVKPLEYKYRVYSYPKNRRVIKDENIVVTSSYENKGATTKQEKTNVFMRVETTYCFINMDKPQEAIEIISYGDGVDSQDKAPGKAVTYADKYALMKCYKIITGDDPDQNPSGEIKVVQKTQQQYQKATPKQQDVIVEDTEVDLPNDDTPKTKLDEIKDLANGLQTKGVARVEIANAIKKHFTDNGKPSANYMKITDDNVATAVIEELKKLA